MNFHKCDPYKTDFLLQKLKTNNVINKHKINQTFPQKTLEENNKPHFGSNYRTENGRYYENSTVTLTTDDLNNEIDNVDSYHSKLTINTEHKNLTKDAPFLVAIFETLSNITAQTCGGTLVSAEWVATPAACLGLLSNYNYLNGTKHYTVVVNATNPLEDGTVHNVSDILFYPNHKRDSKSLSNEPGTASLALMKIYPAVDSFDSILIFKDKPINGEKVRVYGWILKKKATGQDTMAIASFSAKTLDSNECRSKYGFKNTDSAICLLSFESDTKEISQMNSGGPVVISDNNFQILGVVQLDIPPTLIVHPLATHSDWISSVIDMKEDI